MQNQTIALCGSFDDDDAVSACGTGVIQEWRSIAHEQARRVVAENACVVFRRNVQCGDAVERAPTTSAFRSERHFTWSLNMEVQFRTTWNVQALIEREKEVISRGETPFYAIIVARPKRGLARVAASLRYWLEPKLKRIAREMRDRRTMTSPAS